MTYNLITIGCQMNKADSARLSFYLEDLGFSLEPDFLLADLLILITCGVRQSAEDRVYGLVERAYRENKASLILLTGCLSYRPDVAQRLGKKVDFFFDINDLTHLEQKLKKYFPKIKKTSLSNLKNYLEIPSKNFSSFSAFVPIGNGCNNFCSYCVVPYARGPEIYRPFQEILCEVRQLIKRGYREINLIAQNVNSYRSGSRDFADLLNALDKIKGDFWLRFSTSHPKDVSPKLIKILKNSQKICEHFHLAVQSGDNDILQAMNRKYRVEDFKKTLKQIRRALDSKNGFPASITTDVIVGFPGEKKKHFNNTKKLFKEVNFDLAYIARYSPRYGTLAQKMKDDVALSEKKKRELELEKIVKTTALKNNQVYLGRDLEILLEGLSRQGQFFGRSRTAKVVKIINKKGGKENLKIGEFLKVRIKAVKEFELEAEILEEERVIQGQKLVKPREKKQSNKTEEELIKKITSSRLSLEKKAEKLIANFLKEKKERGVVVILGPTASGKTSLAVKMASIFKGEIVSADSRQVYKGMDIGTGKDLAEYNYQGQKIPYHLIDVVSPRTVFSLASYQKKAFKALDGILKRSKQPFLVGGSGLYLEAVIDNYLLSESQPLYKERDKYEQLSLKNLQNKIKQANSEFFKNLNHSDLHNKRRLARYLEILKKDLQFTAQKGEPRYDFLILALNPERYILREKIYQRLIQRLEEENLIGEVRRLKKKGLSYQRLESFGLEYRYIAYYLQNKITEQQLVDQLFTAICQFSKRQLTWFRKMEKSGLKIIYL